MKVKWKFNPAPVVFFPMCLPLRILRKFYNFLNAADIVGQSHYRSILQDYFPITDSFLSLIASQIVIVVGGVGAH